ELRGRASSGSRSRGRRARKAAPRLLIEAGIVAADRDREKVAARERRRGVRKYRRLRPDSEELVDLILQPLAAQRRGAGRVEGVEAQGAVVGAAERAADRVIVDRRVKERREHVDIILVARE